MAAPPFMCAQLQFMMDFKPERYLTVFLVYMVAAAGCKPAADSTQPAPRSGRNRLTRGFYRPADRGGPRRFHLPRRTSRGLGDTDEAIAGRIRGPAVASVTGERGRNRENLKRLSVSPRPSTDDCLAGKVETVTPGRVFISGQLDIISPNVGYQADSAFPGQEKVRGPRPRPSEIWQRLQPSVECGNSAMTVTFRRRRASQVLLHRANESSVPLSRPPPRCGYSVHTTWRDLRLMAQYDACHVTRKHGSYELPLLWRETPVKVSCLVSDIQSQADGSLSVCCFTHSMSVKVKQASAVELLRVNVRGHWTPVVELVEPCGFTVGGLDGELQITAPFINCGIVMMDGKYTLSIRLGDKKFMLACPVSTPEESTLPPESMASIPDPPAQATEHSPESQESFVWTPPFYLAPPLYPHPTYHKYRHSYGRGLSISSPPTPASTFGPPSLPPVGFLSEYQDYLLNPDFLNKHVAHDSHSSTGDAETSEQVLGGQQASLFGVFEQQRVTHSPSSRFHVQVESPSLVPPTQQYHHPNLPLPEAPHIAAAAPVPEFPPPDHATHAETAASHSWYPIQPHSNYQWFHFPHFTDNNAHKLTPFNPDLSAKTNVSSQQSSVELKPDKHFAWKRDKPPSDRDVKAVGLDAGGVFTPEQSAHMHSLPFPLHYPHHYYQMYYGPEHSLSGVSQTPSNNDLELENFRPWSTFPLAEPTYDVNNILLHYDQPHVSADKQDVPREGSVDTQSEPRLPSNSGHAFPVWPAQSAEAGHPGVVQVNPSNGHPHISEVDPVETPDDLLDNEIEDFYLGQYLSFPVPDSGAESTVQSHSAEFSGVTGTLQRRTSDPDPYVDESDENQDVETLVLLTEYPSLSEKDREDFGLAFLNPARLVVEYGSPGKVRLRSAYRPACSPEAADAAQLSTATDQTVSFSESPTSFNEEVFTQRSSCAGQEHALLEKLAAL